MPYLIKDARRSRAAGGSRRQETGRVASINCVSAPNAHMRPQYRRPQRTVDTTVKIASRYQATLYLKIGRSRLIRPKMLTIVISWLFQKPRSTTQAASVTYFSVLSL